MKRPRTKSRTPTPTEDDNERVDADEDSEETQNTRSGSKKPRLPVTRTQSQHKEREREERERQRAEAAKKRSGRAERRRADGSTPASTILVKGLDAQVDTDSDPSEELPLAARVAANRITSDKTAPTTASEPKIETTLAVEAPPPSSQPTPDSPPANTPVQTSSKPKRSQAKRGKGRNQYTKDREAREETSPARSQSRDGQGHDTGNAAHHHHGKAAEGHPKPHSRSKGGFNSKVSMTDLKRKAHAMLDYISRTQVEMAGETTPPGHESPKPGDGAVPQAAENVTSSVERRPTGSTTSGESSTAGADVKKDFKDMSSMEMMARLSTDLIKWQKEFAF